jgi:hypothetical protein
MMLDMALEIGRDPEAGLVDKVVACRAAHQVRADLQDRTQLTNVQCQLVHGLEDLNDPGAAYQVAHAALADLYLASHRSKQRTREHDDLLAAVLRLGCTWSSRHDDPIIHASVAAAASGAVITLEARIWAAIYLLSQVGQRERALGLTDQITAELNSRDDLAAIGDRWRLLLAFHVGRAGYPSIAQQLLAPILNAPGSLEERSAARTLYAVSGPGADTRLQIIGLEAELAVLPPDADDDQLRVYHALAADYDVLGDYRHALYYGQQELLLRRRLQGAHHPDIFRNHYNIALWIGGSGQDEKALRLSRELLSDQVSVLGSDHPDTLNTRSTVAFFTGECGYPAEALRLLREIQPDQVRVLGPGHPTALDTRSKIASWTGECGDPREALRQFRELLPDQERVLGPDHPDTLNTRSNIASWTKECGNPTEALRLFRDLLPDEERVLGPDHPSTLTTRSNIASFTGECGDPTEALRLSRELLPDRERILGPDHPSTLIDRYNIAGFTGTCGDPAEALRLFRELLPDQERVLGPDHPDTLDTRSNIASWTKECGNPTEALRQFRELLRDQERVLGPDHPDIMETRHAIERVDTPDMSSDGSAGGNLGWTSVLQARYDAKAGRSRKPR